MKAQHLRRLAAAMAAMHPDDRWEVSRCVPVHLLPEVVRLSAECRRRFFVRRARWPIDQLFLSDRSMTSGHAPAPVSIGDVSQTLDRLSPWMAAAAMRALSGPGATSVTPAARELLSTALLQLAQAPSFRAGATP
jgi:hypothetical protein